MAKVHGKKAKFFLTDVGGTERDLSSWLNSVEFSVSVDTAEVTTFGENDKTYVIGLSGATIRGSGFASFGANEIDAVLSGLKGGGPSGDVTPTFKYYPNGNATGAVYYQGQCIITSYSVSAPIGGAVTCSFDATITGPVTRNVVP